MGGQEARILWVHRTAKTVFFRGEYYGRLCLNCFSCLNEAMNSHMVRSLHSIEGATRRLYGNLQDLIKWMLTMCSMAFLFFSRGWLSIAFWHVQHGV